MASGEIKRCDGMVHARIGGIWTCEKDRVKHCLVVKALNADVNTLETSRKPLLVKLPPELCRGYREGQNDADPERPDFVRSCGGQVKGSCASRMGNGTSST